MIKTQLQTEDSARDFSQTGRDSKKTLLMKKLFILLLASSVIDCAAAGNQEKISTKVWTNTMFYEEEFMPWETFNGRVRRIIKKTADGISAYSYDIDGKLEEITYHDDTSDTKFIISYDAAGRRQSVCAYSHGSSGIELIDEDGEPVNNEEYAFSAKTSFEYDKNGLLSQDSIYANNDFYSTTSYVYDRNGHVLKTIERNRYDETVRTTYKYDKQGRVIERNKEGNIKKYRYDARGNITAITDNYYGTSSFEYDDHGHITRQQDNDGLTEYTYEYDSYGNPVRITQTYNYGIALLTEQTIEYYE